MQRSAFSSLKPSASHTRVGSQRLLAFEGSTWGSALSLTPHRPKPWDKRGRGWAVPPWLGGPEPHGSGRGVSSPSLFLPPVPEHPCLIKLSHFCFPSDLLTMKEHGESTVLGEVWWSHRLSLPAFPGCPAPVRCPVQPPLLVNILKTL